MAANGMFGAGKDGMINTPNPLSQFTLKMVELSVLDHKIYDIIRDLKLIIDIVQVGNSDFCTLILFSVMFKPLLKFKIKFTLSFNEIYI